MRLLFTFGALALATQVAGAQSAPNPTKPKQAARNAVAATNGDVTRVWYDDLHRRWRRAPVPIAGLTTYGALFCLEQLAIDHRMHVLFRVAHSTAVHAIEGPAGLVPAAVEAVRNAEWPAAMADVVTRCPAERAPRRTARVASVSRSSAAASETLYTWVIAPLGRPRTLFS